MPRAQKILPTPTITKLPLSGDVLSRVRPLEEAPSGIRLALYGRPKSGKTRLACTFPKPLLLIGSEKGTASVVGTKGVDFVLLDRCDEITTLIEKLIKPGKYKSVVLDNGTGFRDMRITEILGMDKLPVQKGWGFASREQWGECAKSCKELLRPLCQVARDGILPNLVIISHEQNLSEEDGDSSGLIKPSIRSALGKSLANWLEAECDNVCQTLIRNKMVKKTSTIAGKTVEQWIQSGEIEYCLRVQPDDIYYAGMRIAAGKAVNQDMIVNPDYEKIKRLIAGEKV